MSLPGPGSGTRGGWRDRRGAVDMPRFIHRMAKYAVVSGVYVSSIAFGGSSVNAQTVQGLRAADSSVEEIYVGRSIQETRSVPPTDYCDQARLGFKATLEAGFRLQSVATRNSDGRIVDANGQTIGKIHVCLGPTADPAIRNLYGEGLLSQVPFRGIGDCRTVKRDFPERGLSILRCFLDLSGLPSPYVGGELTTNTLASRNNLGANSDPPGYTQTSIATIRLWKSRIGR